MKKHYVLASLLCSLILSSMIGCSQETTERSETNTDSLNETTVETENETELKPELPDVDYEGYTFRMGFRADEGDVIHVDDIAYTENAGDVVEDAKYNRNLIVEEQLNVMIDPVVMSGDTIGVNAVNSIMAGDKLYDIIAPHPHIAWSYYIVPGYTLNWSDSLPYCNLDMPWWDQNSRESLSIGGKIYTITGDFSYYSLGYSKTLVFNKAILEDIGENPPYEMVLNGKWTFDEMKSLAEKAVWDVNGDGAYDLSTDRFGYATNVWGGNIDILYTSGSRTTSKDDKDIPYLSFMNEATVEIYDRYFSLMDSDGMLQSNSATNEIKNEIINAFLADQILFVDSYLLNLYQFREMESDWGILPWPKMDETIDRYASNVDAGLHMYVVPIDNESPERTSVILESMSYYGYKMVMPAFYEQALQSKYARDTYSSSMLDIIKATRVFDFGYYTNFNHNIGCAGHYLAQQSDRSIASYYAIHESAATEGLTKMIDSLVKS